MKLTEIPFPARDRAGDVRVETTLLSGRARLAPCPVLTGGMPV